MNSAEFIAEIARRTGLTGIVVNKAFRGFVDLINENEETRIVGLGVFKKKATKPKKFYDLWRKENRMSESKIVLTFKESNKNGNVKD